MKKLIFVNKAGFPFIKERVSVQEVCDRLAAYEDSELMPEDIPILITGMKKLADRASRWIPVSERLPEKSQNCLCFFNDGSMAIGWSNGEPYKFHPDVTHWMPLPAAPKEE
ncbi:MAG TPA: DUF551 domain-containing protein, partial [Anaerovoracaceae bacterium]|nr:DUF551 domain-containing protein [Anaerovoracaceae bacterium]